MTLDFVFMSTHRVLVMFYFGLRLDPLTFRPMLKQYSLCPLPILPSISFSAVYTPSDPSKPGRPGLLALPGEFIGSAGRLCATGFLFSRNLVHWRMQRTLHN